ncbi:hypothetical protein ACLI1A_01920 [Flavobacterium sp. RHBU_3]|uniref:hypothetical protein n=1 Tax=Flavobacterium sp. RHBU_3 TaxID=3391184 RepID=UPI003984FE16
MENLDLDDFTSGFSVKKWKIEKGSLTKNNFDSFNIVIPISKFVIDGEIVETSIRLEFIELVEPISNLVGKTVVFPLNPEEGYIDGSVYLRSVHNPVDVTEIRFDNIESNILSLEIVMRFDFEYEGIGFENESLTEKFVLELV